MLFREHERKMVNLRSQKNEFKEGFWNVNSVMLGGLGKDPHLEGKSMSYNTNTPLCRILSLVRPCSGPCTCGRGFIFHF